MDDFGLCWFYKDSFSIYQCLYSLQKASSHTFTKDGLEISASLLEIGNQAPVISIATLGLLFFLLYTLYKWPPLFASQYVTGNSGRKMDFFFFFFKSLNQETKISLILPINKRKQKKSTNKVKFLWKWIKILLKFLPWFFFYLCQVISPSITSTLLFTFKFKLHRVPLSYVK